MMRADHVRDAMLHQLLQLESGSYLRALEVPADLSPSERRRLTEYVGGITRQRRWLDFVIDHFSNARSGIEIRLRLVLRIGTYELVELESPPHAVVDASVEQAKRRVRKNAAGFANAVLRQIGRHLEDLPRPRTGHTAEDLAIQYSHPTWMVERWIRRFGRKDTRALLRHNNRRPHFGIRINSLTSTPETVMALLDDIGVSWTRSAFLDDYLRVTSLQAIRDAGLFRDGSCAVQDESAGIVVQAVNPQPGEVIVDACAAPGGKLIRMGMLMRNQGRLIAVDPNEERLAMAVKSARQHGITIVESWCGDFTEFRIGRTDRVDKVLIDAPCTGLGVLARRADLRWQKTRDSFTDLMALQDKLLDRAVDVVNSGGLVTYATCTISPEENNDRIVALLDRNGGVVRHALPDSIPKSILDANGQLATLPHRDDIDGAFAATVQKR